MKKKQSYRRFIRVGLRLEASPEFARKSDAEKWYEEMKRKKQFLRDGIIIEEKSDAVLFMDYAREWMIKRMKNYPASTWKSDEQRLRVYILPHLSEFPISSIKGTQIRNVLIRISEPNFVKQGLTISPATMTRVKALMSAIFGDALNEDPPLVNFNPVTGIRLKDKRRGVKKPRHLANAEQCLKFIECANEIGKLEWVVASIFLMSGLRKQELIALRWKSFDAKAHSLTVSEKYEQTTNTIKIGTKAGEDSIRTVPISSVLTQALLSYQKETSYPAPDDFIVCRADGRFLGARDINRLIEEIRKKAGLDISPHGLRHTFGREFAQNTGNIKALQSILGHSSSSTTDLYSDLSGERTRGFGEAVSFGNGVKQRIQRHIGDTKKAKADAKS